MCGIYIIRMFSKRIYFVHIMWILMEIILIAHIVFLQVVPECLFKKGLFQMGHHPMIFIRFILSRNDC